MSTGKQYVYNGVLLKCDKGALPTPLTVLPRPSRIRGQYQATEIDLVPGVNIKPFGACAITHGPCVPLPLRWAQVHQGALRVGGVRPLLETSKCLCSVGGEIEIFMTAAAAEQAVREDQAHEASDKLKTASMVLAVGALACAIGGLFFPPLEIAAVALADAAEVTFVASVAIDVGVFVAHPTVKNGLVVVGDAVGIALGAAAGKYVLGPLLGKAARALAEKEAQALAEREAQALAEREAKALAEREAKELAEREARELAEKEARELAERQAREAQNIDATRGGHSYAEHSSQVTESQHEVRLRTGQKPSGVTPTDATGAPKPPPSSSGSFSSDAAHLDALSKADQKLGSERINSKGGFKKKVELSVDVPNGGVSYSLDANGNLVKATTDKALAVYKLVNPATGDYELVTLFPVK